MRRLAALFAAMAVLAVAATPVAAKPPTGYAGVWQAVDCAQLDSNGPLDCEYDRWGDGSKVLLVIGRTATPAVAVNDDYAEDCSAYATSTHWTAEGTGAYEEDGTLWVSLLRGRCGSYQVHLDDWGWGLYWDPGSDTLWLDPDGDLYGLHFWRVAG